MARSAASLRTTASHARVICGEEGRPVSEAHPDVKNSGAARVDLAIKAEFPSHAAVTDSGKS